MMLEALTLTAKLSPITNGDGATATELMMGAASVSIPSHSAIANRVAIKKLLLCVRFIGAFVLKYLRDNHGLSCSDLRIVHSAGANHGQR